MQRQAELRLAELASERGWTAYSEQQALTDLFIEPRRPPRGDGTGTEGAGCNAAGVTAFVHTVDMCTPLVHDPYMFGAVAAANVLGQVYGMGAWPTRADVIATFPEQFTRPVREAILRGGADKVAEAGAVLANEQITRGSEIQYGLRVTGEIDCAHYICRANARPGDQLLLTKPLGTGVITTALERNMARRAHVDAAVQGMIGLNKAAAELARALEAHCVVDVGTMGLLGHAEEMARNSGAGQGLRLRLHAADLPLLPGALHYAKKMLLPGQALLNQERLRHVDEISYPETLDPGLRWLLFDPQTSGGLLIALPSCAVTEFERRCVGMGMSCWRIGEFCAGRGVEIV